MALASLSGWILNKVKFVVLLFVVIVVVGLFLNDCYESTPEVEEAIRRLPSDVFDARNKRIATAFHLSLNKIYLPKEQWTKYEDDVKYLEPYLEEVNRENAEKEAYEHNNFST